MAYSWPIWNKVSSCNYKSNKNFGFRETGVVEVNVGSSKKNSHHFVKHITTKRKGMLDGEPVIIFSFSVDGIVLKMSYFKYNNGRAGAHIKDISNLTNLKSL